MLKAGDILDGKYHIIEYIGKGRWGCVFLAENLKLGNKWAVKEISLRSDPRVNLQAEPEILKRLNHPSLPRIVDVMKSDDFLYIIEDYFEGRNLRDLVKDRNLCCEDNAITWGKQLCKILLYLHSLKPNPIIYRDMKPGNIIIDSDNNVKLVDFGIAREYSLDQDSDSTFIGTIGYAAPEQYRVGSKADERTDIYGLGVTLHHVLTGNSPGNNPERMIPIREVHSVLSPGIEKIITRCTQQIPDDRYQSAQELLADLENIHVLNGELRKSSLFTRLRKTLQKPDIKKTLIDDKFIGTVVIAVGGTNRGVGCTYASIALASFLSRQRFKVAIVEVNENPSFSALENEECYSGSDKGYFRKAGVDFYWQNFYNEDLILNEALRGGYDFVVIDLGRLVTGKILNPCYEEMFRANIAILVAGSARWQLKDLAPCMNQRGSDKWNLLFSAPDNKFFGEIKSQLKSRCFATVFSPDPFNSNVHQDSVFTQILQCCLSRNKFSKNKLLFWK